MKRYKPDVLTLSFIFQGDYIWIEPISGNEFDVAIGARVISAEGRRIQVRDDDGQEQWLTPERRIKAMHATSVQGVEDMIGLGDLHEAGILRNLLIRYNENLIYVSKEKSLRLAFSVKISKKFVKFEKFDCETLKKCFGNLDFCKKGPMIQKSSEKSQ